MPQPSHRPDAFRINRIFTDRDEARALFQDQLAAPQAREEYRVLNFSGIGGLGKSALCGEFEKHLKTFELETPILAWAKVNFQNSSQRSSTAALLALRMQLAETGHIRFPAFDIAFARYFALNQAGRDLKHHHPELFRQPHDLLQSASAVIGALSGISFLDALIKGAYKAEEQLYLYHWRERCGNHLLQSIENLTELQLENELPKYFGADIDDWLQNPDATDRRVALLYDTYEALWELQPNKADGNVDAWVQTLIAETPAVLHVILGRETLVWDKSEWGEIIQPFPLDNLPDADAQAFLQAVPIPEADIRARIVQGAQGIPFYLELQVEQYATLKNQAKIPQAEDFGGQKQEILDRFVSHLPDTLRRALEIAAQPQWLDEPLFLDLCEKFLGGRASVRFSDLTRYSFWTQSNGRYYLHAVLREYVHSQLREKEAVLFAEIHRHLFDYYDGQLQDIESARDFTSAHITALTEGSYHLAQVAQVEVPYWVGKYRGYLHLAAQWAVLQPLLQQSLLICQEVGNKEGEGTELNNLSSIYYACGDYDTALDYFQKSLAISWEIGDKAGEAVTLNNLATTAHVKGDYATALDYLQQSLEIQQEIGEKVGESAVLNNLSQIYKVQGDYVTAQYYLQQSLSISRVIGYKKGVGQSLNNLATIAYAKGDYEAALSYSQQSMEIRLEIGNKAGVGQSLNNLSQIYMARGDYATALNYLQQSLVVQRDIGDQAGISLSLFNIGHIYQQNGESERAMQHWHESYQIAQKIGHAQALSELEKLAEQLGLPNGLAGWDALGQQMEGT
ncbi:MAG: tetratricopeptide repeat protein [Gallionella sp.]|nr:tetratricopeptide repeat protein [Gallionella sp.]MDD4958522.1 tetratricopeptide repeat protein [Gallionella sp.]